MSGFWPGTSGTPGLADGESAVSQENALLTPLVQPAEPNYDGQEIDETARFMGLLNISISSGRIRTNVFNVVRPQVWTRMATYVATGGGAGSELRMGVCSYDDGGNGVPQSVGDVIHGETAAVPADSVGWAVGAVSFTLQPGKYCSLLVPDDAVTIAGVVTAGPIHDAPLSGASRTTYGFNTSGQAAMVANGFSTLAAKPVPLLTTVGHIQPMRCSRTFV